jgi:hypothetical protein
MEMRINARRFFVAFIIITISYFYFRFFGIGNYTFAHYIFAAFIMGSLVTAFLTKKRDVTVGILYGLIFVLVSLLLLFIFFSELLD